MRTYAIALAAITAIVVAVFLVGQPSSGQQEYRAPRLANTSQPDLNGIWQAVNSAHWDLEGHEAAAGPRADVLGAYSAMPAGLSVVDGGAIPYQPWAVDKKKENAARRLEVLPDEPDGRSSIGDPEAKCFLPGVPRATYMPYPFQITQSPSPSAGVLIAYEYAGTVRAINMGAPMEAPVDSWMGWSNGRWDGDTLVVDVTAQNGYSWFDRAGNFASAGVRVVERYTPTGPDHLFYEATIEDPKVFTRPWRISMPLYRRKDPGMQLLDFKCIEFAEEFMYGRYRKQATN